MRNVSDEIKDFILHLNDVFNLRLRVAVSVRNLKNFQGFYELRLSPVDDDDDIVEYWHDICVSNVNNHSVEDFKGSIAHEFVHAWQHEQGLPVNHDESFNPWIIRFREEYNIDISSQDCLI